MDISRGNIFTHDTMLKKKVEQLLKGVLFLPFYLIRLLYLVRLLVHIRSSIIVTSSLNNDNDKLQSFEKPL